MPRHYTLRFVINIINTHCIDAIIILIFSCHIVYITIYYTYIITPHTHIAIGITISSLRYIIDTLILSHYTVGFSLLTYMILILLPFIILYYYTLLPLRVAYITTLLFIVRHWLSHWYIFILIPLHIAIIITITLLPLCFILLLNYITFHYAIFTLLLSLLVTPLLLIWRHYYASLSIHYHIIIITVNISDAIYVSLRHHYADIIRFLLLSYIISFLHYYHYYYIISHYFRYYFHYCLRHFIIALYYHHYCLLVIAIILLHIISLRHWLLLGGLIQLAISHCHYVIITSWFSLPFAIYYWYWYITIIAYYYYYLFSLRQLLNTPLKILLTHTHYAITLPLYYWWRLIRAAIIGHYFGYCCRLLLRHYAILLSLRLRVIIGHYLINIFIVSHIMAID